MGGVSNRCDGLECLRSLAADCFIGTPPMRPRGATVAFVPLGPTYFLPGSGLRTPAAACVDVVTCVVPDSTDGDETAVAVLGLLMVLAVTRELFMSLVPGDDILLDSLSIKVDCLELDVSLGVHLTESPSLATEMRSESDCEYDGLMRADGGGLLKAVGEPATLARLREMPNSLLRVFCSSRFSSLATILRALAPLAAILLQ